MKTTWKTKLLIGGMVMGGLFFSMTVPSQGGEIEEKLGREIQKAAQLRWAEGVMVDTVQAALRSLPFETAPATIPSEAFSVIRANVGFEPEENLRRALTLLEEEKGMPFTEMLPAPVVMGAANPVRYVEKGWGGFGEFGLPSLLGFAWAMVMFSWILTDPDRTRIVPDRTRIVMEKVEKAVGVTSLKAA